MLSSPDVVPENSRRSPSLFMNRSESESSGKKRKIDLSRSLLVPKNAAFPSYEKQVELISEKAENAKLQLKVNALNQELVDSRSQYLKDREELLRQKQQAESSAKQWEKKINVFLDREKELKSELTNLRRDFHEEKNRLLEQINRLTTSNVELQETLSEVNEATNGSEEKLVQQLNEEEKKCAEYAELAEMYKKDAELNRKRVSDLREEVVSGKSLLADVCRKYDEQSITLRQWREENKIANALRYDVADIRRLNEENVQLKQQVQRFKNLTDNITLLKQEKVLVEEELNRAKKRVEKYILENSEIKMALSRQCHVTNVEEPKTSDKIHRRSLTDIDFLSQRCSSLKAELDQTQSQLAECHSVLAEKLNKETSVASTDPIKIDCKEEETQTDTELSFTAEQMESKDEQINFFKKRLGLLLDYDPDTTDIFHLIDNPLDKDHLMLKNELNTLQKNSAEMKLRLEELEKLREQAHEEAGVHALLGNVTLNVQQKVEVQQKDEEIEDLKQNINRLIEQRDRVAKQYRDITVQYREICTQLTGYQIKLNPDGKTATVQSQFERSKEDSAQRYFHISKNDDGTCALLESDYAEQFRQPFVEAYLTSGHSFPAFLAAITLHLYNKELGAYDDTMASTSSIND